MPRQPPQGAPQGVAVPAQLVRAIQTQLLGQAANAVVSGDYDGTSRTK